MSEPKEWFLPALRIAGASFMGSASLVQWHAELDRRGVERRLSVLEDFEDPIAQLHPDVHAVCEVLHQKLKQATGQSTLVELEREQYEEFSRPLAALESAGLIKGSHSLTMRFFNGLRFPDPTFRLYLWALFEEPGGVAEVRDRLEALPRGERLNASKLSEELGVPVPYIEALFQVYASKGYGIQTQGSGPWIYIGMA